jgi:hypothetical protein
MPQSKVKQIPEGVLGSNIKTCLTKIQRITAAVIGSGDLPKLGEI